MCVREGTDSNTQFIIAKQDARWRTSTYTDCFEGAILAHMYLLFGCPSGATPHRLYQTGNRADSAKQVAFSRLP